MRQHAPQAEAYTARALDKIIKEFEANHTPPATDHVMRWKPIATADKNQERLTLGIFRGGKLEEIHVGGYRHAINEDEESCWWSEQCDDEIVPTHWMPDLSTAPPPAERAEGSTNT